MAKHIELTGEVSKFRAPINQIIFGAKWINYTNSDHADIPVKETYGQIKQLISTAEQEERRFQAATAAMQGVMASPLEKVKSLTDPDKAYYAVVMADHLLTQLTPENKQ